MYHIYLHTLTLYEVFSYFFIYSFLGWVSEVAFHAIKTGKFVNRGFLSGPVCPIYGSGVVAILLILGEYAKKPWCVFLVGVAVPTLLELFTGWILECFFHNKWWDYSDRRFNFKGYICLEFSLLWGIAEVCVISVLHPFLQKFVMLFSELAGTVIVAIALTVLLVDVVVTVLQVLRLNRKLAEIDKMARFMRVGSDFIGKEVAVVSLAAQKGVTRVKDTLGEKKEILDEKLGPYKEDAKAYIDEVVKKMPKRLLKAFPSLSSRKVPQSVALVRERMEEHERERRRRKRGKNAPSEEEEWKKMREDCENSSKGTKKSEECDGQ